MLGMEETVEIYRNCKTGDFKIQAFARQKLSSDLPPKSAHR
jgi:hypothetical protein